MADATPLTGQVALVTGASRGIGAAIAKELAAAGATVVVNYASSPTAAEAVVGEIQAAGGQAWSHQANVADEEQVEGLIKAVLEKEGRLDVLVNNAGITRDGLLMRMKTADWQSVIDLNLSGVFLCYPRREPLHAQSPGRPHHQHHLRGGVDGQPRAGQLQRCQGRGDRSDPQQCSRIRQPRRHGECRGPRLHRERHDR